jgi:tetratricopeptide (TPR) repeat protein
MTNTNEQLVNASKRVLIYLSKYRRYMGEMDASMEITQIGIADAIGIAPTNIARVIRPLINDKSIEAHCVHVPGIRQKRLAYYPTNFGLQRAQDLKERILNAEISVIDLEGQRKTMTIKETSSSFPFEISLVDILTETKHGTFDCRMFASKKKQLEKAASDLFNKLPPIKRFWGRKQELRSIEQWLGKPTSPTLVVQGIAGVGKTTLLTKAIEKSQKDYSIYYYEIKPWTSLRAIMASLADFLEDHGKAKLKRYIDGDAGMDLSEIEYILSDEFSDTSMVFVYDNFQSVKNDVLTFMSLLHGIFTNFKSMKLAVLGRKIEPFYDIKEVNPGEKVILLKLKGLDKDTTIALAKDIGMIESQLKNVYERTKGLPLFVELLNGEWTEQTIDMDRYIIEEFMKSLMEEEMGLIKFLSVFRYPTQRIKLRSYQRTIMNLAENSIVNTTPDGLVYVHDLIKEVIYRHLTEKEYHKYHSKAAEYYLESLGVENQIEALHHLAYANRIESATDLLLQNEAKFTKNGKLGEMTKLLLLILCKDIKMQDRKKARLVYLLGTALSLQGEWDDALDHYRRGAQLAGECEDERTETECLLGMAKIMLKRNEYKEAEKLFETVLKWTIKNKATELGSEVSYQLGSLCEREGNLELARKHFKKSLDLANKAGNKHQLAKAYYGLGRIQHKKCKFEKALESKNKALDITLKTGDEHTAAKILTSIGGTLDELGRRDEEIKAHERAIELARKNGAIGVLAYALSNAGAAYIDKTDLIMSSRYFSEASEIFEKLKDKYMIGSIKLNMAMIICLKGDVVTAKKWFNESLNIFEHLRDKHKQMVACFKFGQTLKKCEHYEESQKLLKKALSFSHKIEHSVSQDILKEIEEINLFCL